VSPFLQIILAGLGTYLIRVSFIATAGRMASPSRSTQATLRLIAPAVLAAILADRLFLDHGRLVMQLNWWIAGVVAGLVAFRWRSAGVTMAAGMVTIWVIAALT